MSDHSRVCLTTYIYGTKYQNYIPLLLYSCHKAYPEYDVILFLYDKLDERVKMQIEILELSNKVVIHEHYFSDCPKMSPLKSKALRWVLWDDLFNDYDYLYTIDIDMLYIKEPIPLHSQHISHMNYIGLPISNMQRELKYNPLSPSAMKLRIENAGIINFMHYFKATTVTRISGLHFVDIKKYYSILDSGKLKEYTHDIYTNNYLSYVSYPNNEVFLAKMLVQIGFDISKMGIQQDIIDTLDYSNPQRLDFRPHHGIHLGIFRKEIDNLPSNSRTILDSKVYEYYVDEFVSDIMNDKKFLELSKHFTEDINVYMDRLKKYYSI